MDFRLGGVKVKYIRHFITITRHKVFVMLACFRAGLIWQGITHDLSKYSLVEFAASAKYFQGNGSPIDKEKRERGYSIAWQNHKGKNRHHWHYWTDFEDGKLIVLKMPPKYVIEMICDWVGAGKAYNKGKWTIDTLKAWYAKNRDIYHLHTSTKAYIDLMMKHVKDESDLYRLWLLEKRISENYWQDDCEGCSYQPRYDLTPFYKPAP
jgi:hypothetical protein